MFDEKFMSELPEEPYEAAYTICARFVEFHKLNLDKGEYDFDSYLQALALAEAFIESHGTEHPVIPVVSYAGGASGENIREIVQFFNIWRGVLRKTIYKKKHELSKVRFAEFFGKRGLYEFSDDDFQTAQTLINEMRELLTESEHIERKHKNRLLKRLEALQAELHKKMSNFDRFWGFWVDASIYMGICGENAKPFLDKAAQLLGIVAKVQAIAEDIPNIPMLPRELLPDSDSVSKPIDPSPG